MQTVPTSIKSRQNARLHDAQPAPSGTPAERLGAFTLIELLVVISIIAILSGLILPSLSRGKAQAKKTACATALKQVIMGAQIYADEHEDAFHNVDGKIPNNGRWYANPRSGVPLSPDHPLAYWGVAYEKYVGNKNVFRCPAAKHVDEWREDGLTYGADFWLNSSLGINRFVVESPDPNRKTPRKLSEFKYPASTIFCQDAAEQKMEGDSDSWGLFPGFSENLTQWRYGLADLYPEEQIWMEWFRHSSRGQAVWLDGHVSSVPSTKGVDYRWYTGELPQSVPPDR